MSDGVPDPQQPRPRKAVSRARQRWSVMVLAGAAESLSSAKQEKLQVTTVFYRAYLCMCPHVHLFPFIYVKNVMAW